MADRTVSVRLEAITSAYTAKMAQAAASTKAFGNSVLDTAQKNRQSFQTLGIGLTAFGAAIGAVFGTAAKAAIDFESSFAGVRKTVEATEPQFEAMSQGLRDMAKQIPVNVNELNAIAESAGQLGIRREAILGFTETVAKMGVTTDLVGEQAANAFARISNIMGTSQKDFDRMGSTIVALGNAGASTESEISEMALRISGAGKQIGLTEAEVLGFSNALASVGINAEAGGSAISRTFINIADAVASGGKQLRGFADVAGLSVEEFRRLFERDAASAMIAFIEGLDGIRQSGGNVFKTLEDLGLSEIRVRDALLRASGAGDLFRESLELGSKAWKENNALNEEAAKRFATTESQIQLAKNEINDFAISVGDVVKGGLKVVVKMVGGLAGTLNDLPGPIKAATVGLTGFAGAASLLGGGLLLLLPRIADTRDAMAALGGVSGIANKGLSGLGALLSPTGAIIGGLALLTAAYIRAKNNAAAFDAQIQANVKAVVAGGNEHLELASKVENLRNKIAAQESSWRANTGAMGDWTGQSAFAEDSAIDLAHAIRVLEATEEELDKIIRRKIINLEHSARGLDAVKRQTIETYLEDGAYTIALRLLGEEEQKARHYLERLTEAMKGHNLEAIRAREISRQLEQATRDAAREDRQHAKDISDKEARTAEYLHTLLQLPQRKSTKFETPGLRLSIDQTARLWENLKGITAMGTIRAEFQFQGPSGGDVAQAAAGGGTPTGMFNYLSAAIPGAQAISSGYRPGDKDSYHSIPPPWNAVDIIGANLTSAYNLAKTTFGSGIREMILDHSIYQRGIEAYYAPSDHTGQNRHLHLADVGARITGPALVRVGAITEDVHLVPRSGPGAVKPLPMGRMTPASPSPSVAAGGSVDYEQLRRSITQAVRSGLSGPIELVLEDGRRLHGYIQEAAFDGFRQAARAQGAAR